MNGEFLASDPDLFLSAMATAALQEVTVAGRTLRPGSRVRLRPKGGGDVIDTALAGRVAVVEGIDEDDAGESHVAVILEEGTGLDLAPTRHPAHRFFFAVDEIEPLEDEEAVGPRVLVAGIGNVFFGDDGFGVAVAKSLLGRALPRGVEVADFGIRGMDLAYALTAGYDAAILVDASPRGGAPGTVYLMEPDGESEAPALDSHQMNPLAVLGLARRLGPLPGKLLVVGCEPSRPCLDADPMRMELTTPVADAVERAAEMIVEVVEKLSACTALSPEVEKGGPHEEKKR
jgi:hydrogenase maturation protease